MFKSLFTWSYRRQVFRLCKELNVEIEWHKEYNRWQGSCTYTVPGPSKIRIHPITDRYYYLVALHELAHVKVCSDGGFDLTLTATRDDWAAYPGNFHEEARVWLQVIEWCRRTGTNRDYRHMAECLDGYIWALKHHHLPRT